MNLVVTGRPNKQLAAELGLSEITVKVHRGNVMQLALTGSQRRVRDLSAIEGDVLQNP